jgi:hypothetical protein
MRDLLFQCLPYFAPNSTKIETDALDVVVITDPRIVLRQGTMQTDTSKEIKTCIID